jgi:hypothetical protein
MIRQSPVMHAAVGEGTGDVRRCRSYVQAPAQGAVALTGRVACHITN